VGGEGNKKGRSLFYGDTGRRQEEKVSRSRGRCWAGANGNRGGGKKKGKRQPVNGCTPLQEAP